MSLPPPKAPFLSSRQDIDSKLSTWVCNYDHYVCIYYVCCLSNLSCFIVLFYKKSTLTYEQYGNTIFKNIYGYVEMLQIYFSSTSAYPIAMLSDLYFNKISPALEQAYNKIMEMDLTTFQPAFAATISSARSRDLIFTMVLWGLGILLILLVHLLYIHPIHTQRTQTLNMLKIIPAWMLERNPETHRYLMQWLNILFKENYQEVKPIENSHLAFSSQAPSNFSSKWGYCCQFSQGIAPFFLVREPDIKRKVFFFPGAFWKDFPPQQPLVGHWKCIPFQGLLSCLALTLLCCIRLWVGWSEVWSVLCYSSLCFPRQWGLKYELFRFFWSILIRFMRKFILQNVTTPLYGSQLAPHTSQESRPLPGKAAPLFHCIAVSHGFSDFQAHASSAE